MTEMIPVHGGEFQMGDTDNLFLKNTRPVHTVIVSSFFISKYQVSQNEWSALLPGQSPGTNETGQLGEKTDDEKGDHPVTMVGWLDAVNYCNRLSEREGLPNCYVIEGSGVNCDFQSTGYRLPSEAEWEYAARGGQNSNTCTYAGNNELDRVGWYKSNSGGRTRKRGLKKPNELGIFDMSGNVWEWCWDWFVVYTSGKNIDPRGPDAGDRRVYRGGSCVDFEYACTVASRGSRPPHRGYSDIGFRVARSSASENTRH